MTFICLLGNHPSLRQLQSGGDPGWQGSTLPYGSWLLGRLCWSVTMRTGTEELLARAFLTQKQAQDPQAPQITHTLVTNIWSHDHSRPQERLQKAAFRVCMRGRTERKVAVFAGSLTVRNDQ